MKPMPKFDKDGILRLNTDTKEGAKLALFLMWPTLTKEQQDRILKEQK